jgi:hypothetical protein
VSRVAILWETRRAIVLFFLLIYDKIFLINSLMFFMKQIFKISSFVCISLALFLSSKSVFAFNTNQEVYITQSYDSYQRSAISTIEIKPTSSAVFYADKE